ncbi:MAG: ribosome maturation factor RimM [Tannerellaceae bacterium]|nr:16S rRNA processing protein RimM [Porphyromonadaceae bacterium]
MIREEDVISIGSFVKPHGVKGEIAFAFTSDVFDRAECPFLICDMDGILVPFFVEDYRFKGSETALIKFEGVDTEERAKMFAGKEVYFPKDQVPVEEDDEYTWQYFEGFTLLTEANGEIGTITEVDESTQNILFTVEGKYGEVLIPAAEEWILGVDHEAKQMLMVLPEGLLSM